MTGAPVAVRQLIARDAELDALNVLRRAAAQGHGALVLIEGEAGIGKSRLLAAFRATLGGGRAAVGTARCREFGNVPYAPVREALRAIGAPLSAGAARDRAEHLAELHDSLVTASARRLVVLAIEDVQWADDGSLRFLAHALPTLRALRALVIATYRTEQSGGESVAGPYLARFAADAACRRFALGALSRRDTARLVVAACEARTPGGAAIDVDRIVERSEGNPFFAEELVKDVLERGAHDTRALPFTIRGLVEERVRELAEDERRFIALAAVIGRAFDAAVLARIAKAPLDRVLEALRRARQASLIEEIPGADARFAFRHGLTREAIYDGMLVAETRRLHARILGALEARREAELPALGYHAWAAGAADACVRYNERAGDAADALYAYPDAVRCYERALSGAHSDRDAARLLNKMAGAYARDGNARRATELYEAAAQAAQRGGDAAAAVENYQLMCWQARLAGDSRAATAILERTMRMFPQQETALRAKLALSLAYLHLDGGDTSAADELLERTETASAEPMYHSVRLYAATVRGDAGEVRAASARYVAACSGERPERAVNGRFNEPFGLTVLGYDDEALEKFERLLPELRERRLTSLEVLALANSAIAFARRGRLLEARECVERGLAVPEPATTGPIALASAALTIARPLADEQLVARSVTPAIIETAFCSGINSTLGRFAGPYARWTAARGDAARAAEILRRAMGSLTAPFAATGTLLAAVELGDPWTRRRALDFLPAVDAMDTVPIYAATALHLRALASRVAGEPGALAYGREAAQRYAALGWPLLEAAALEIAGDRAAAARLYERAGASYEMRRLKTTRANGSTSGLSAREREIAALIARGTPNAQLAERFAVNRRTIEKHLTSIYGKLGIRNRSELAALIATNDAHGR